MRNEIIAGKVASGCGLVYNWGESGTLWTGVRLGRGKYEHVAIPKTKIDEMVANGTLVEVQVGFNRKYVLVEKV